MSSLKYSNLTPERKKKIEQNMVNIFKDIHYNDETVLKAKSESDLISDEIRKFILGFSESSQEVKEVDLFLKAKEKGQELVEGHELVFFDGEIDEALKMRAFLIPGMKVDFTDEDAAEKITEDDLQAIDHELCISFKTKGANEFVKLGNLLDIRATLAKALSMDTENQKKVVNLIKENRIFKNSLDLVLDSANRVLERKDF